LFVRVLLVLIFAAVVASGVIFAKPISQAVFRTTLPSLEFPEIDEN
jgi:hypothetical protein